MTENIDHVPALQPLYYDAARNRININEVWIWQSHTNHDYVVGWFGFDEEDVLEDLIEAYRGDIKEWEATIVSRRNEEQDNMVAMELSLPRVNGLRDAEKDDEVKGWRVIENALDAALEPTDSILFHGDNGVVDLLIRTTDDDGYEVKVDPLSIYGLSVEGTVKTKERAMQDASVLAALYGN